MKLEANASVRGIAGRIIICAITLIAGILVVLLSQLGVALLPLLSPLLVILFVAEKDRKPIFSIIASSLLVVLDLIWSGLLSISCFTAVIVAILIYLSLTKSILSKGECALAITAIISLSIGIMLILGAFVEIGKPDFAAALQYYTDMVAENREVFVQTFNEHFSEGVDHEIAEIFTPEVIGALYDSHMNVMISFVVIIAFLLCGLALKLVRLILIKSVVNTREIKVWHFELSPIFAYFYLALFLLGVFFSGNDVLSIALLNLTNIFMFIFSYVGFVFALAYFRRRFNSKAGATVLLLVVIVLLYSLAVSLLSFVGVFATLMISRLKSMQGDEDHTNYK